VLISLVGCSRPLSEMGVSGTRWDTGFVTSNSVRVAGLDRGPGICRLSVRRTAPAAKHLTDDDRAKGPRGRAVLNLPNVLTLCRVAAVPFLTCAFVLPGVPHRRIVVTGLFVAAAVTDYLDGVLARRLNQYTSFGAFLDPVADKIMVATVLVLLSAKFGLSVALASAIIVCREIAISALREWMAMAGDSSTVAVGLQGKIKTALQMVSLSLLLYARPESGLILSMGLATLYISALLALTSAYGYVRAAMPRLLGEK